MVILDSYDPLFKWGSLKYQKTLITSFGCYIPKNRHRESHPELMDTANKRRVPVREEDLDAITSRIFKLMGVKSSLANKLLPFLIIGRREESGHNRHCRVYCWNAIAVSKTLLPIVSWLRHESPERPVTWSCIKDNSGEITRTIDGSPLPIMSKVHGRQA